MNTIGGCMKTILIPEFGVQKTLSAGDNVIEFTPTKSGTFDFTCGMGMGRGKIIVEENDGTVAANTGAAPAPAARPFAGGCH